MVPGSPVVAVGRVRMSEAAVRASLLVCVSGLKRQVEREGMPGASLLRLAHREQYLAAAIQCFGLTGLVTELAEQGDRSLIAVGG
jgi:hypothetical protein